MCKGKQFPSRVGYTHRQSAGPWAKWEFKIYVLRYWMLQTFCPLPVWRRYENLTSYICPTCIYFFLSDCTFYFNEVYCLFLMNILKVDFSTQRTHSGEFAAKTHWPGACPGGEGAEGATAPIPKQKVWRVKIELFQNM